MYNVKSDNIGILNEIAFAKYLDKKKYCELPDNYKEMLKSMFSTEIENNTIISCWKSKYKEKADIKIKINKIVKGISIKMGGSNSVHLEKLDSFIKFLTSLGISDDTISDFKKFIIGKHNNKVIDNNTYKKIYQKSLLKVNNELNDFYVRTNIIIRCLFKGSEINRYNADVIIHGTPQYFIWATKSEILKHLIFCKRRINSAISISSLNIQSWYKQTNDNTDNLCVQVKWHIIKSDLKSITAKRNNHIS